MTIICEALAFASAQRHPERIAYPRGQGRPAAMTKRQYSLVARCADTKFRSPTALASRSLCFVLFCLRDGRTRDKGRRD
jgi:hypothetical protein